MHEIISIPMQWDVPEIDMRLSIAGSESGVHSMAPTVTVDTTIILYLGLSLSLNRWRLRMVLHHGKSTITLIRWAFDCDSNQFLFASIVWWGPTSNKLLPLCGEVQRPTSITMIIIYWWCSYAYLWTTVNLHLFLYNEMNNWIDLIAMVRPLWCRMIWSASCDNENDIAHNTTTISANIHTLAHYFRFNFEIISEIITFSEKVLNLITFWRFMSRMITKLFVITFRFLGFGWVLERTVRSVLLYSNSKKQSTMAPQKGATRL